MDSKQENKPHALIIPAPAQGHINPMLKLAKILHSKGFLITFVNTEFSHRRLVKSQGSESLNRFPSFRFETIPDGLPPPENTEVTQNVYDICRSTQDTCLQPFIRLVGKLSECFSPVTCIVSDLLMGFTLDAAKELGIPEFIFSTGGAGALVCSEQFPALLDKGLMPLKAGQPLLLTFLCRLIHSLLNQAYIKSFKQTATMAPQVQPSSFGLLGSRPTPAAHTTQLHQPDQYWYMDTGATSHMTHNQDPSYVLNGYLDTIYDSIPSMKGIPLKYIPPFIRYSNPGDEFMVEFTNAQIKKAKTASGIIFNTFDDLEHDILGSLASVFPPCYGIGPLHLLENNIHDQSLASIASNLWKEELECIKWLDSKPTCSVVYVNFGSIAVMTPQQLLEFCWGLANSKHPFLWILRAGLVSDELDVLPPEFFEETSGRGMLAGWCPQEEVISHPSIGGFLTHSGWNSTVESISSGVPMICWPFFSDQFPNCWLSCTKWGVAMEIDGGVKRDEVEGVVIELMEGEKGKMMRKNAMKWKNKAIAASSFPDGSSVVELEKLIHQLKTLRQ